MGTTEYEAMTIDELATKGREQVDAVEAGHREKLVPLLDAFVAQAKGLTPIGSYQHMAVDELLDERTALVGSLPSEKQETIDAVFEAIVKNAGWRT